MKKLLLTLAVLLSISQIKSTEIPIDTEKGVYFVNTNIIQKIDMETRQALEKTLADVGYHPPYTLSQSITTFVALSCTISQFFLVLANYDKEKAEYLFNAWCKIGLESIQNYEEIHEKNDDEK